MLNGISKLKNYKDGEIIKFNSYTGFDQRTVLIDGHKQNNSDDFGIEGNLFQVQIDEPLDQNMFDDFPGKKIHLSRQYIPCSSVNLIGTK